MAARQSNDACAFHPIQAATAKDGVHAFQKPASEILVGDIVFCAAQRPQLHYAHIVLAIQKDCCAGQPKYWIGNIQGRVNGRCHHGHVFGVLAEVQARQEGQYCSRPRPQPLFERVAEMVRKDRWSQEASCLCEPQ